MGARYSRLQIYQILSLKDLLTIACDCKSLNSPLQAIKLLLPYSIPGQVSFSSFPAMLHHTLDIYLLCQVQPQDAWDMYKLS